jgi:Zn-dependent metalloprotease
MFRYLLFSAAFAVFNFHCLFAQVEAIKTHFFDGHREIPQYMEFAQDKQPALADLEEVFAPYWKDSQAFDFELLDVYEDQFGEKHNKYRLTYQGIPIMFEEIIVHNRNGRIRSINGNVLSTLSAEIEAKLAESDALQAALNHIGAEVYKWELASEENFIKQYEDDPLATYYPQGELFFLSLSHISESRKVKLSYRFNVYAHEPMGRYEIYVDANDGKVLFQNNLIHTSNVKGTAVTAYSGSKTIHTDSVSSNSFRLRQTVYGNGVNTYDLNNNTSFSSAVDFTDADNYWNNKTNLDQYATDAHWGAEQTYDYFDSKFSRNSINNRGFALNSFVHYGSNYANAFWNGQYMTYGDGNNTITPLTALDIAGHEIAHGLTTFSANLIYERESGALNESFSDIFGTAIEFYGRPNGANWTVGEDIGTTLRSMSNPNRYSDPDTYAGIYWLPQPNCVPSNQNDNCGVHINSGVQNFWFYLLTNGGSGTNDKNNSYSVTGLGIDTAAQIAYRNLVVYLNRSSDFQEARFYSIQSAIDLYGACSPQVESVTDAWHAVGVGKAYLPGVQSNFISSDTVDCRPPLSVYFDNESNNGINYTWYFGDGDSSSQRNPNHVYASYGQFDVTLITDGGTCGADTMIKQAYVNVDSANICSTILRDTTNATVTECQGRLFDSGGASGNYANQENGTITISPAGASSISLSIVNFDIESGTSGTVCDYDYLEIYDGSIKNGSLIGRYCNNNKPPATITTSKGQVSFKFYSDQGLTQQGFRIDWSCSYPTSTPVSDFTAATDSTCTGEVQFNDESTNGPVSWYWEFGDGRNSTLQYPTHTYLVDGTYDVTLVTSNTFGSDTLTKRNLVYVDRPLSPTGVNDTTCTGQTASLSASGAGSLEWYNRETGGILVNSGTSFSIQQPAVDTTFWVQDHIKQKKQNLGPSSNNIGNGRYYSGDQHLVFDVYQKLILTDVFVYPGSAGNRTIELRDSQGKVLQSKTQYIPNTLTNVNLNFTIEPGTNYQLGVDVSNGGPDLYRNNSGVNYPYTLPGMLSIKSSSASSSPSSYYYFFYYWRVKTPDCISPRIPVIAVKDSSCNVTSIKEDSGKGTQISIYPNPSAGEFTINWGADKGTMEIELLDIRGSLLQSWEEVKKNKFTVNEALPPGIYFLKLRNEGRQSIHKIIINK